MHRWCTSAFNHKASLGAMVVAYAEKTTSASRTASSVSKKQTLKAKSHNKSSVSVAPPVEKETRSTPAVASWPQIKHRQAKLEEIETDAGSDGDDEILVSEGGASTNKGSGTISGELDNIVEASIVQSELLHQAKKNAASTTRRDSKPTASVDEDEAVDDTDQRDLKAIFSTNKHEAVARIRDNADVANLFASEEEASERALDVDEEEDLDGNALTKPALSKTAAAAAPVTDAVDENDTTAIAGATTTLEEDMQSKHLVVRFPSLAKQYASSNPVPLADVLIDSGKVVGWNCDDCKSSWQQAVFLRVILKSPCPQCDAKKNPKLGQVAKALVREWDTTNNDPFVDPEHVPITSSLSAHWVCSVCKTAFEARVKNRIRNPNSCPTCSVTTLQSSSASNETIKLEWHPVRNGDLKLQGVSPATKVWWLCSCCGHEWEASVAQRLRVKRASHCTQCKGASLKGATPSSTPNEHGGRSSSAVSDEW